MYKQSSFVEGNAINTDRYLDIIGMADGLRSSAKGTDWLRADQRPWRGASLMSTTCVSY